MPPCCASQQTDSSQPLLHQWDAFCNYNNTSLIAADLSNSFFFFPLLEVRIQYI